MTKLTIKEATEKWVSEFNAIPQAIIAKAYPSLEEMEILTTEKECVNCGSTDYFSEGSEDGEGEDILTCSSCGENEFNNSYGLPMWGTMWTFGSSLDEEWARNNLDALEECGIWVYESDELGVFFGINGAGYDFYEQHWMPLYEKRGLQWHE